MRLAVFSDVHGNLEALRAFARRLAHQDIDYLCCLGDLVGYGPNPNECINFVRSLKPTAVILGNHDWAALDAAQRGAGLNPVALEAIRWTSRVLGPDQKEYLSRLYPVVEMGPYTLAHASPYLPFRWDYLIPRHFWRVRQCFRAALGRVIFVGHTHDPLLMTESGDLLLPENEYQDGTQFCDNGQERLLVNPGSIGQPRDTVQKPSYVIHDISRGTITWYRLTDYDPEPTVNKIVRSALPEECAWHLLR